MTVPAKSTPIAIIGLGCLFPQAASLRDFWNNIRRKVDSVKDVPSTHWKAADYYHSDPKCPDHTYARRGAFLDPIDFPPMDFGIQPHSLEAIDSTQLLGLMAARAALMDAGYGPERLFDRQKVSVILGITGTLELVIPLGARLGHPIWRKALRDAGIPEQKAEEIVQRIADSYVGWQEDSFPGLLGNVVAGRIANRLNLQGTNCVVDAACASSLSALHLAMLELQSGRADMVVTGGMDTFNDIFMYMCFSKTPALSPSGDARPFDANGDGTILGEGLGCFVIKRLADAERDGDPIHAILRGIGTSSDGKGQAIYAPSSEGQVRALQNAYQLADVSPSTIELVEAHGTGTKAGDAAELAALYSVYGPSRNDAPWCAIGSIKSQIGHTKAAAGAAGLMKAVLALKHKVLPPTIKVTQPLPPLESAASPFYVNSEARPWLSNASHPRRAAVSSFGFGGSNFHVVVEESQPNKVSFDWDGRIELVTWSGATAEALLQKINAADSVTSASNVTHLAYQSRLAFRADDPYRLAMLVNADEIHAHGMDYFQSKLSQARKLVNQKPAQTASLPDGIYFGIGSRPGGLAFLFPGQGSQYIGMLRDLACQAPPVFDALTLAEKARARFSANFAMSLVDVIYPHSLWTKDRLALSEARLRETQHAQAALGAMGWGTFQLMRFFGITANAMAGHSYGELLALAASGRFCEKALMELSLVRGACMADAAKSSTSGMLAVRMHAEEMSRWLIRHQSPLRLANLNSPKQVVLAGNLNDIQHALQILSGQGVTCSVIPVAAAFHSPIVAAANDRFKQALLDVDWQSSNISVYSNVTAAPYPADGDQAYGLLGEQMISPVRFEEMIRKMHDDGIYTFLELGPEAKLTGLVQSILSDQMHHAMALDSSRGKREGLMDLARVLGQLAASGYHLKLPLWQASNRPIDQTKSKSLTIPLCGSNYRRRHGETVATPAASSSTPFETHNSDPWLVEGNKNSTSPLDASVNKMKDLQPTMTQAKDRSTDQPKAPETPWVPPRMETTPPKTYQSPTPKMTLSPENLLALQRIAEQTARLHQQFLDGQNRVLEIFQSLVHNPSQLGLSAHTSGTISTEQVPTEVDAVFQAPGLGARDSHPLRLANETITEPPKPPFTETNGVPGRKASPQVQFHNPLGQRTDAERDWEAGLKAIVSEKTGYPAEMLNLEMELDTDLGIDSIKRVEIFAAVQEQWPDAPAIQSEHIGKIRTLQDVIGFIRGFEQEVVHDAHMEPHRLNGSFVQDAAALHPQDISVLVREIIGNKTGYPPEMLEERMELDADLGIDSIKRVEIFAALQERLPHAPQIQAEDLGRIRTLQDIVKHLGSSIQHGSSATEKKTADFQLRTTSEPVQPSRLTVSPQVDQTGAIQETTLRAWHLSAQPLDIQAFPASGWTPQAPVAIVHDDPVLAQVIQSRFQALSTSCVSVRWSQGGDFKLPLRSLILIPPMSDFSKSWQDNALRLLQSFIRQSSANGIHQEAVSIICLTFIDGQGGIHSWPDHADPRVQGLLGMLKCIRHEHPWIRLQLLDAEPHLGAEYCANALSTLVQRPLPMELGLTSSGWTQLQLMPSEPARQSTHLPPWGEGEVTLVTGGARGITAAVTKALAQAWKPTLLLLGRTCIDEPEPNWLLDLRSEPEIKRALMKNHAQDMNPKQLQKQYERLMAQREVRSTLNALESLGGRYEYVSIDLRCAEELRRTMADLQSRHGPIRHLIHGAGVLADKPFVELTPDDLSDVYETKIDSLEWLLEQLDPDQLQDLILFSSTTARFGRQGQAAYALANEVLNKWAVRWQTRHPRVNVVSFNWGPWDGGMVKESLKPLFQREHIQLIPQEEGSQFVLHRLQQPRAATVELVVMKGDLPDDRDRNFTHPKHMPGLKHSTNGSTSGHGLKVVLEREVSVGKCPILEDHVLNGRAILPMALLMEWLAQTALHEHPGWHFTGLDNFKILKGVTLHINECKVLQFRIDKPLSQNGHLALESDIIQSLDEKWTRHASSVIQLSRFPLSGEAPPLLLNGRPEDAEIYEQWLFHGPRLQGIESILATSEQGIRAWVRSAPPPKDWLQLPWRHHWIIDPLVLDAVFQLAIVWSQRHHDSPCLPTAIGRYRQHQRFKPNSRFQVEFTVQDHQTHRVVAQVAIIDEQGQLVAALNHLEAILDERLHQAFRRNQLLSSHSSV